jgi:hypothetical protein
MEKQSAAFPHPANNVAHNSIRRGVIHITTVPKAAESHSSIHTFYKNQEKILADKTIFL